MDGPSTGIAVFFCLILAGLGGMSLRTRMPQGLLSREVIAWLRRGVTTVTLLAVLFLAYTTISLKTSFDRADREVKHLSAQIVELDRSLRRIGPDAMPLRDLLFRYTNRTLKDTWPDRNARLPVGPTPAGELREQVRAALEALPHGDRLRMQSVAEAQQYLADIATTRLSIFENTTSPLSAWVEGILVLWLMITFGSLGLAAPRSPIVVASLLLLASVIGSAAFLMQEFDDPFAGLIVVSSAPMENALFTITE